MGEQRIQRSSHTPKELKIPDSNPSRTNGFWKATALSQFLIYIKNVSSRIPENFVAAVLTD
jgi:hypothetical protein